jgi:hypothetical protein
MFINISNIRKTHHPLCLAHSRPHASVWTPIATGLPTDLVQNSIVLAEHFPASSDPNPFGVPCNSNSCVVESETDPATNFHEFHSMYRSLCYLGVAQRPERCHDLSLGRSPSMYNLGASYGLREIGWSSSSWLRWSASRPSSQGSLEEE